MINYINMFKCLHAKENTTSKGEKTDDRLKRTEVYSINELIYLTNKKLLLKTRKEQPAGK